MKEYTAEEKYNLIKQAVLSDTSKNPADIARTVMKKEFVGMHGSEHHFLDGAAFIAAYKNAGGKIDADVCLDELAARTAKMPGAMCGYWGICGAAASVGAALSVIHGTSPLSTDDFYKDHMEYTSTVIREMSKIGGARCCKRNAFICLTAGAAFVKNKYSIEMDASDIVCDFFPKNAQCIGKRCPFRK